MVALTIVPVELYGVAVTLRTCPGSSEIVVGEKTNLAMEKVVLLLLPPPQADQNAVRKRTAVSAAIEADENRRMYPPRTIVS